MKRRTFIETTSLATAGFFVHPGTRTTNEKIKLGIIGVGWWGRDLLLANALASDEFEIVAICDVNQAAIDLALNIISTAGRKKPRIFKDYRELYELVGLEAVVIATPPHWHALQFIDACEKGLDIWLEKPISYDIREAQAMRKAHEKAQNIVTVDFPRLWGPFNTEIKDYIQSGQAGEIIDVHFQIHNGWRLPPEVPQPETLNYEMFCGPAPKVSYRSWPNSIGPYWRGQYAFDRGILADYGIHFLENVRHVMDLKNLTRIQAMGAFGSPNDTNPISQEVLFEFENLPVIWSHKNWGYSGMMPHTNVGVIYNGTESSIFSGEMGWEVYSKDGSLLHVYGDTKMPLGHPDMINAASLILIEHFKKFAQANRSKDGQHMKTPFQVGFDATTSVILADIAFREKLELQLDGLEITNHENADPLLIREYRSPYRHPYHDI